VEYRSDRGISGRSQFLLVRTSVASHYPPRHLAPVAVRCERQFRGEFSETPAKGINKWAAAISPSSLTAQGRESPHPVTHPTQPPNRYTGQCHLATRPARSVPTSPFASEGRGVAELKFENGGADTAWQRTRPAPQLQDWQRESPATTRALSAAPGSCPKHGTARGNGGSRARTSRHLASLAADAGTVGKYALVRPCRRTPRSGARARRECRTVPSPPSAE